MFLHTRMLDAEISGLQLLPISTDMTMDVHQWCE
jgi:hypothetical protein